MKKIRKSNIAGEILFLLGIIILWQIFYVAGVDGLGIWKAYSFVDFMLIYLENTGLSYKCEKERRNV